MNELEAVRAFSALAHAQRLRIFRALVAMGSVGLSAGEIANVIGASATAASFHLKELERAGLIESRRDGRYIRYAVVGPAVGAFVSFLADDCCGGRPELCGDIAGSDGAVKQRRRKGRR